MREETTATATTEQIDTSTRFVVTVDGEERKSYAKADSAKRQVRNIVKNETTATASVIDRVDGVEIYTKTGETRQMMDAVDTAMDQLDAEEQVYFYTAEQEAADYDVPVEDAIENDETIEFAITPDIKRKGENAEGVSADVLWAAGNKLQKGKVIQEYYAQVCKGEMTLDEAVAQTALIPVEERPATPTPEKPAEEKPKKATGNPDKKRRTPQRKEREKAEAKPPCAWRIVMLNEDGSEGETLYEYILNKELLQITEEVKDTGKSRKKLANQHDAPVKMININTGKEYTAKPAKKK